MAWKLSIILVPIKDIRLKFQAEYAKFSDINEFNNIESTNSESMLSISSSMNDDVEYED